MILSRSSRVWVGTDTKRTYHARRSDIYIYLCVTGHRSAYAFAIAGCGEKLQQLTRAFRGKVVSLDRDNIEESTRIVGVGLLRYISLVIVEIRWLILHS